MGEYLTINENGFSLVFEITDGREVRFLQFKLNNDNSYKEWTDKKKSEYKLIKALNTVGNKKKKSQVNRIKYHDIEDNRNEIGRRIVFYLYDRIEDVEVKNVFQFLSDLPVVQTWTEVDDDSSIGTAYVSSFPLDSVEISMEKVEGTNQSLQVAFPSKLQPNFSWNDEKGIVEVIDFNENSDLLSSTT